MKNKEKATKFSSAGVKKWILNNSIYIVLVALIVIITAVDSTFLSLKNLWFIVTQASTRMILALEWPASSSWAVQTSLLEG